MSVPKTSAETEEAIPTPPLGMTAESQTRIILDARSLGDRGKYAIAKAFINIATYQFHRAYGYETLEEFWEKVLKGEPSLPSVRDWAEVAKAFTADQAAELTCHKLSHFLTYAKRKGIADLSNPGDALIEVPDGDQVVATPLRDCSTTDVERALARLAKARPEVPSELDDGARRLQDGLASFLGAESYVRVNVARRSRGAVIQVDNLQAAEVERLIEQLARR